jgi:hypothetical protein
MTGSIIMLKPALLTKDGMCSHQPRCPDALAPDCTAAWPVACRHEQGWSLLCNGVVLFDDGGQLLPDGRAISPASTCTAADLPRHAAELAAAQPDRAAAAAGGCDALVAGGLMTLGGWR